MLRCHVPKHLDCHIISDLQHALNNDLSRVQQLVSELRFWITQRRCEKTLQHLPATPFMNLPLLHPPDHLLTKISRHRIFLRLHHHPHVIMVKLNFIFSLLKEINFFYVFPDTRLWK